MSPSSFCFDDHAAAADRPYHGVELFNEYERTRLLLAEEKPTNRQRALSAWHSPWRALAPSSLATLDRVAGLGAAFPNFSAVLDYVCEQLALSLLADQPAVRLPPLLLDGPPGSGKTLFSEHLARALATEFYPISCTTVTAGWVLFGNSTSWADGRPGQIAETLRVAEVANPLILLDEIDKLRGDHRFSATGPLHDVLEPETARRFQDECLGLRLDVSHILWVATSNDAGAIEDSIRSRLVVFRVRSPSEDERRAVARSVWRHLLAQGTCGWEARFSEHLSDAVIDRLIALDVPPRAMRAVLIQACARTARRVVEFGAQRAGCRYQLRAADLTVPGDQVTRPPIGFVHS